MTDRVKRARRLAEYAHRGQYDRDGELHIEHVEAVARLVDTEDEQVVAWLHDALEDTRLTARDLATEFDDMTVCAVRLLTRVPGMVYAEYIRRIAEADGYAGDLARAVKRKDLAHNLARSRANGYTSHVRRYEAGLLTLA